MPLTSHGGKLGLLITTYAGVRRGRSAEEGGRRKRKEKKIAPEKNKERRNAKPLGNEDGYIYIKDGPSLISARCQQTEVLHAILFGHLCSGSDVIPVHFNKLFSRTFESFCWRLKDVLV